MNEELNIKELLAELAVYRWRDKKETILRDLKLTNYLSTWRREEIIKAYETNSPFTLFELLDISKEADVSVSKGCRPDEITKAVMEWVKERLNEIEKEKEDN